MRGYTHKANGKEVILLLSEVCNSGYKSAKVRDKVVIFSSGGVNLIL